jgi:hypothetical protein
VSFGDKNFEVVNEFLYLEALVAPNNDEGLEKNRNCKQVLLQPLKLSAVLSGTSDKVNNLQVLDLPGPAVRQ